MSHKRDQKQAPPNRERGASSVEYALLVALIAAVIVGVMITLGQEVFGLFELAEGAFG